MRQLSAIAHAVAPAKTEQQAEIVDFQHIRQVGGIVSAEELFGTHIAGEVFFQHLQQLLGRNDSADLADVLEVHYLCLLLGFGGRYSAGNRGELAQVMNLTAEKIRRIRGPLGPLSPASMFPQESVRSRSDPLARKLGYVALACAVLMLLLFGGYALALSSGVSAIQKIAAQG